MTDEKTLSRGGVVGAAEDTRYPIYTVTAKWTEDGEHDPKWPSRQEGLPAGRIHNSTSLHRMYTEDQEISEIERWAREEWWPEYIAADRKVGAGPIVSRNPSDPEITIELSHRESWCLSWFEHWTFDVGQSDAEALASFERYVRRYEHMQDPIPGHTPEGYVCLMGAEDRWRWTGGPGPDDRNPPPCRCEHCKAQGKIRIGH